MGNLILRTNIQHTGPKIMILYASYGEGHIQASRALQEAFELHGITNTIMVDLMAAAHPWINEMTKRVYMKSFTMMPGLYGWVYDITRPMKHDSLFASWLHSFGRETLRRILAAERPHCIIHTFPVFVAPALRKKRSPMPPTCAVITDFDLHRRWVHPGIDRYYVSTDDMRQELVSLGISERRVCTSGIPVKRAFSDLPIADTTLIRHKFGFSRELPIVLIMAGAQGVLPDISALCSLLLANPGLEIALVCGRNAPLARSVRRDFAFHPEQSRLHVFDYVDTIHELMSVAACIVTKPGGITLTEAIAARLPIFIYRPVPGQERNNAYYMESKGAAVIAEQPHGLAGEIVKLINDPVRLDNMGSASGKLHLGQASDRIVLDILQNLNIMEGAHALVKG
ncbi:glycosyltransferase [Paenibacillus tarimensis]